MPGISELQPPGNVAYPFADVGLARRLERAEGMANARFVEARARLFPDRGAAWVDIAGTYAMFDGVGSPITQTFGFGLFSPPSAATLDAIEHFFHAKGSPAFHEVCPLADPSHGAMLGDRGYQPFEFSSVMYQPVDAAAALARQRSGSIGVRAIDTGEHEVWGRTAAAGWSDAAPGLDAFLIEHGRIAADCADLVMFLAEDGGVPIAAAALSISGSVALFAGASTIPAARHRGAQLALLAERLAYAAAHDCDLAMMVALPGSGSQRNAERNGFRIAYTRTKWRERDAQRS